MLKTKDLAAKAKKGKQAVQNVDQSANGDLLSIPPAQTTPCQKVRRSIREMVIDNDKRFAATMKSLGG